MKEFSSFCQSCAMPFMKEEDYGTERDGSKSDIYCRYCYQNGDFTDTGITIDQIAEHGAAMISQMYSMPMDKARIFMKSQIQTLKRWSGRIIPSCQSCGMPMISADDAGTEQDGKKSSLYCTYCYQHGVFTEPDLTKEEMLRKSSLFLSQQFDIPQEKATEMAGIFISTLSRWK